MKPTVEVTPRRARALDGAAFRVGTVLAVLVLSAVGFAAALLLSGWADELQGDDRSGVHALSRSAVGYNAALRLLQDTGVDTELRRSPELDWNSAESGYARVYTLPPNSYALRELVEESYDLLRDGGPVLFVMPKWDVRKLERGRGSRLGWVETTPFDGLFSGLFASRAASGLEVFGPELTVERREGLESYAVDPVVAREIKNALGRVPDTLKIEDLQALAPGWTDIEDWRAAQDKPDAATLDQGEDPASNDAEQDAAPNEDDSEKDALFLDAIDLPTTPTETVIGPDLVIGGAPVLFSVHDPDDGAVLYHVLTEPDLLNTHGLNTRTRARLALGMLAHLRSINSQSFETDSDGIAFDLSLHGFSRSSNIIKTLTRPPLLAATLCAVAALALLVWTAFVRFGDPVRGLEVAGAGAGKLSLIDNGARLVHLARRTVGMADDYAFMRRRRLLRDIGMDGARAERIDTALQGLQKRTGRDVDAAIARVAGANDPGELVTAARLLHDTVGEVT